MPQRLTCGECNKILYEGDLLKGPDALYKKFLDETTGKACCPYCGKELRKRYYNFTVSPAEKKE